MFESESTAGGVLLFGIPEYRLPKEVLARDIKAIEEAGVKIHLNTKVGEDVKFEDLTRDYDAVYIATGTQFCKTAGVIGEDKAGVYHGLDFLKEISHGSPQNRKERGGRWRRQHRNRCFPHCCSYGRRKCDHCLQTP